MPWTSNFQWGNENEMQPPRASAEASPPLRDQGDYRQDGLERSYSPRDSPPRPPVSPITPVKSFASLASTAPSSFPQAADDQQYQHQQYQQSLQQQQNEQFLTGHLSNSHDAPPPQTPLMPSEQQQSFISHPAPVSLAESDNPDVIALRAAMYVLQTQKEKAKRDMQKLVRLKADLAAEPDTFTEDLLEGRLKHAEASSDPVRAMLETADSDSDSNSDVEEAEEGQEPSSKEHEKGDSAKAEKKTSKFGAIPSKQNVVRTPHINWAKYHVIGDSLDKMHEEQRLRPSGGEFGRPPLGIETARAPEQFVAAPYSPFQDGHFVDSPVGYTPGLGLGLDSPHPMQTRRGSKKL